MKFRDDIDPSRTWVISDTHFGHDNIINFCHRPTDHEQIIMENWAQIVPKKDSTVLHLGDLAYKSNARFKNLVAPHLTGERKLLIMGNHDRQRFSFYKQSGFLICRPFGITLSGINGVRIAPDQVISGQDHIVTFSHYPWAPAPEEDKVRLPGEYDEMAPSHTRVHGHIHNNGYRRESFVPFIPQHINVSLEQMKYRPVLLRDLLDGALLGRYHDGDQGIQNG